MHHFASSRDQQQAHQKLVPIALEVETLKTDEVLQLVVYLHSETQGSKSETILLKKKVIGIGIFYKNPEIEKLEIYR